MSNLKKKYQSLIRNLFEKTRDGEIDWEILRGNEVYCTLGGYDIHLKVSRDAEGEPLEIVELRDQSNDVIDSFNDTDIADNVIGYSDIQNYYGLMASLRVFARRRAMGADEALDTILKNLEEGDS